MRKYRIKMQIAKSFPQMNYIVEVKEKEELNIMNGVYKVLHTEDVNKAKIYNSRAEATKDIIKLEIDGWMNKFELEEVK